MKTFVASLLLAVLASADDSLGSLDAIINNESVIEEQLATSNYMPPNFSS